VAGALKTAVVAADAGMLRERGAEVTIGARDEKHLAQAEASLGDRLRTVPVDATNDYITGVVLPCDGGLRLT
jgi:NADP-dependent 3-hydroxy acid dehydrogenase YdfG